MLTSLVALNENLKSQEQKFKASCKAQLNELKEQIEALKKQVEEGDDEMTTRVKQQHEEDSAKLRKLRQLAAKRNRVLVLRTKLNLDRTLSTSKERSTRFRLDRSWRNTNDSLLSCMNK